MRSKLLIILLYLFSSITGKADYIQFTASAPKVVEAGEQFEVTYNITAQPSGFKPPEFKNFNLLGGPSTSSSSSVQIINGKVIQSSSYSYTYYFSANTPGNYTIDAAKATVDGKNYMSNSITIEVVSSGKTGNAQPNNAQQGAKQNNANQNTRNQETVAEVGNEDIFTRVLVDRNNLYQGDHLIATIKLYSKLNISAIENVEFPAFTGFFRQDIETPQLKSLEREVVNGQVYATGVIQKLVLFPQKNGEITIDPFTMQCVVQIQVRNRPRSIFDDFWGPSVQEVRKKIKSRPVKINVKPLPLNNSASFHGAVGNFNFKAALDKNNVKTNDAITLKVIISGNGNLKMIEPFDIKFPSDFETYDPKVSVNISTSTSGVSGSKTFEYLLIPRHSGDFKIPEIVFTYFDTQSNQFKTLSSGEMDVKVEKSANEPRETVISGISKEDVKYLGKDIQFIKTQLPEFTRKNEFFFGSLKFWLFYLVSTTLFFILVLFWRKRIKENANILRVRNKKANKVAHKKLKDAHLYMKDNRKEEFFEYILKALWGYMSDKLSIPVAELSREKILEETGKLNIDSELIKKFLQTLDNCEFARYAPYEDSSQMDKIYNDSISIISKIEQKIR